MGNLTSNYTKANGEVITYSYPTEHYTSPTRGDARRTGDKNRKGWQVAEMWESHHEMARMILLGHNNIEIGETLGVTPQQVSNIRNSPVVKDKLTIMKAARDVGAIDLSREISTLAPIALQAVREALETGKVNGKEVSAIGILKEANGILDREMGKPTQRVETRNLHGHLTMEDIDRIKNRARELAGVSGQVAV